MKQATRPSTDPVFTVRHGDQRGHVRFGWLDSRHTFSFGEYHDPRHMGFGALRVINDDRVAPGAGFPSHPHRNMEILTYVLDGALEHQDSLGNGSVIRPGDVQRMTAGTGVVHSEYNHSATEPVRFLQIWVVPARGGLEPGYEQQTFPPGERRGRLRLVASPDGADGSVTVHQDARLYATLLDDGTEVHHTLAPGRRVWVHVARGQARVGELDLDEGDGLAVEGTTTLRLEGRGSAEVLVFDLG